MLGRLVTLAEQIYFYLNTIGPEPINTRENFIYGFLNEALIRASKAGNADLVKSLIEAGATRLLQASEIASSSGHLDLQTKINQQWIHLPVTYLVLSTRRYHKTVQLQDLLVTIENLFNEIGEIGKFRYEGCSAKESIIQDGISRAAFSNKVSLTLKFAKETDLFGNAIYSAAVGRHLKLIDLLDPNHHHDDEVISGLVQGDHIQELAGVLSRSREDEFDYLVDIGLRKTAYLNKNEAALFILNYISSNRSILEHQLGVGRYEYFKKLNQRLKS